jgi:predicted CXXCH cytochrome family protein
MNRRLTAGVVVVLVGVIISAPLIAGIQTTVHNLGSSSTVPQSPNGGAPNRFDGTAEVCVFCHTPHGGDTTAAVPLWNRVLSNAANYRTYDQLGSSTLDGNVAKVGSVTLACLSCHDGTQAMDTVINAPGSGGFNPAGSSVANGGSWSGDDQIGGRLIDSIIQNIGTDLTNDHPVGIQYAGGGVSATNPIPNPNSFADPAFKQVQHRATLDNRNIWWVDGQGGQAGIREADQDVFLYTRSPGTQESYGGQSEEEPFVECASCHNPHDDRYAAFLRINNEGSELCLTCHTK